MRSPTTAGSSRSWPSCPCSPQPRPARGAAAAPGVPGRAGELLLRGRAARCAPRRSPTPTAAGMLLVARATSRAERDLAAPSPEQRPSGRRQRHGPAGHAACARRARRVREPRRSFMLASWYDRQGPAAEVLQVGELPDPDPGPGEVRVRVRRFGRQPRRHQEAARLARLLDALPAGDPAQRRRRRRRRRGRRRRRAPRRAARVGVRRAVLPPLRYRRPVRCRPRPPRRAAARPRAATSLAPAWASPASPRTAPSSPTARSTAPPSSSTASSAAVGSMAAQLARWGGATVIGTVTAARDLDPRRPRRRAARRRPRCRDPAAAIRAVRTRTAWTAIIEVVTVRQRRPRRRRRRERRRHRRLRHPHDRSRRSPSGPCCSPTSPCACSAATTSPREAKRQAARDLTAAAAVGALTVEHRRPLPARRTSPRPTTTSTPASRGRVLVTLPG